MWWWWRCLPLLGLTCFEDSGMGGGRLTPEASSPLPRHVATSAALPHHHHCPLRWCGAVQGRFGAEMLQFRAGPAALPNRSHDVLTRHGSFDEPPIQCLATVYSLVHGHKQLGEPATQSYLWQGRKRNDMLTPCSVPALSTTTAKRSEWEQQNLASPYATSQRVSVAAQGGALLYVVTCRTPSLDGRWGTWLSAGWGATGVHKTGMVDLHGQTGIRGPTVEATQQVSAQCTVRSAQCAEAKKGVVVAPPVQGAWSPGPAWHGRAVCWLEGQRAAVRGYVSLCAWTSPASCPLLLSWSWADPHVPLLTGNGKSLTYQPLPACGRVVALRCATLRCTCRRHSCPACLPPLPIRPRPACSHGRRAALLPRTQGAGPRGTL